MMKVGNGWLSPRWNSPLSFKTCSLERA